MLKPTHTQLPWPAVEYNNDVGPNDDGFWEWWEIPGIAKFDNKDDALSALRAVNAYPLIEELTKALETVLSVRMLDNLTQEQHQFVHATLSRVREEQSSNHGEKSC